MNKQTISLFFGAGAEISYGMPTGGEFALNIFRQDQSDSKKLFRDEINNINKGSFQAKEWLPDDYANKQVSSFNKTQHENLLKSSLEYRKSILLDYLNNFDKKFVELLNKYNLEDENKMIITLSYSKEHDKKYYQRKLRLTKSTNLKILRVDSNRKVNNQIWYESIK